MYINVGLANPGLTKLVCISLNHKSYSSKPGLTEVIKTRHNGVYCINPGLVPDNTVIQLCVNVSHGSIRPTHLRHTHDTYSPQLFLKGT